MIETTTTAIKTETTDTDQRVAALAAYLEIDAEDVTEARYGDNQFDADGAEYLVLTDEEADNKAKEYILDSLWAFNASFLAGETGIDEDVFTAISNNNKCESNNDAISSLIKGTCGFDSLVESAVCADGRGHFMSSYDGEENEQGDFFIYRTN
jgi:hypothetical protein